MSIKGNTMGVPNPQPNWNQTDENKADFIIGKPETMKNPKALVLTGAVTASYDGSEQIVVNIPTGGEGGGGAAGASAYEIAVSNGFEGTEAEWLESLKGEQGVQGIQGVTGKSAYEYAQQGGYNGTEEEFQEKLATECRPASWLPTAEEVGAAPTSHKHSAVDVTGGVLSVLRGGTGCPTHSKYSILTGNAEDPVSHVNTESGALFAMESNGRARFGTLPIAQGGTGATTEADARAALGTNMTLLWTNGSPTSTFAAQSVSIDGANYDCYVVVAHASTNTDATTFLPWTICYKEQEGHLIGLPNNKNGRRAFSVNADGTSVTFKATEYCKSTYGTSVTENQYIVPMYIYGMYLTTT